jgi:hypothetical protein
MRQFDAVFGAVLVPLWGWLNSCRHRAVGRPCDNSGTSAAYRKDCATARYRTGGGVGRTRLTDDRSPVLTPPPSSKPGDRRVNPNKSAERFALPPTCPLCRPHIPRRLR